MSMPTQHFNTFGWREGRDPDAFFSIATYLSANPDVRRPASTRSTHFDTIGWIEGRVPSIRLRPGAVSRGQSGRRRPRTSIRCGISSSPARRRAASRSRRPSWSTANGFDYVYYLSNNPDVAAAGVDPFAALHDGRLDRGTQSERAVRRERLSRDLRRRRRRERQPARRTTTSSAGARGAIRRSISTPPPTSRPIPTSPPRTSIRSRTSCSSAPTRAARPSPTACGDNRPAGGAILPRLAGEVARAARGRGLDAGGRAAPGGG